MSKGARRAPQEIKIDFAVLPLLNLYLRYCLTAKQSGLQVQEGITLEREGLLRGMKLWRLRKGSP